MIWFCMYSFSLLFFLGFIWDISSSLFMLAFGGKSGALEISVLVERLSRAERLFLMVLNGRIPYVGLWTMAYKIDFCSAFSALFVYVMDIPCSTF